MPSGLGCWFSRGLLPAENALKCVPLVPESMWLSKASDKMLRAELCVQRNKTLRVVIGCCDESKGQIVKKKFVNRVSDLAAATLG